MVDQEGGVTKFGLYGDAWSVGGVIDRSNGGCWGTVDGAIKAWELM